MGLSSRAAPTLHTFLLFQTKKEITKYVVGGVVQPNHTLSSTKKACASYWAPMGPAAAPGFPHLLPSSVQYGSAG